jgi:hypothetical protein
VSKLAAQNPGFAPGVRKVTHTLRPCIESLLTIYQLMKEQESHVKSWEVGRKNLIEEHKLKRENERMHRAALYVNH